MRAHIPAVKQPSMTARRMFGDKVPRRVRRLPADLSTARYYDEHAESYAEATRTLPLHAALSAFVERLDRGAPVLDLGCGAGRDLRALSLAGLRAVGLDASQPLVELAAEYSGCPVTLGDVRSMPFEDGTFAGVWASASLVHLQRGEISDALREVSRVLQPGGYFFSSVKTGVGEGFDSRGRWFTYFDPQDWLALIDQAGFTLVESNFSRQKAGTLDTSAAVDWFDCTVQKC
jgi:SAM-dependent methyltransferase